MCYGECHNGTTYDFGKHDDGSEPLSHYNHEASVGGTGAYAERKGAVDVITLDRPSVRNAIDFPMACELERLVTAAERCDRVEALVLCATGAEVFCAGSDLKAKARGEQRPVTVTGGFAGLVRLPRSKPLVAAVEGLALGGGFELVLASDLAIASERAEFGLPEVEHGIVAGGGGLFRLPRAVPPAVAAEVILAGRRLTAEEALRWGLVNRLVDPGSARSCAIDLAQSLCGPGAFARRESLRVLRAALAAHDPFLWELTEAASLATQRSQDGHRGVQAFAARSRPPR